MIFCTNCGAKLEVGNNQCSKCNKVFGTETNDSVKEKKVVKKKFCNQCGIEIDGSQTQCSACGEILTKSNSLSTQAQYDIDLQINNSLNDIKPVKVNINLSKRSKIILAIFAIIVLISFVGYKTGLSLTDKDKMIQKFEKAMIAKDKGEIKKYIKSSDSRLVVDEESIDGMLTYIEKNPSYLREITNSLYKQSVSINNLKQEKSEETTSYIGITNESEIFTLKKQGKTLLLFDKYVLEIKPYFINVTTNYKGTQILINDKEACISDTEGFTKQIGPYMPGMYKIKAVYKGQYVTLEKGQDISLLSNNNNINVKTGILNVNLKLQGKTISVKCDYTDAKLFANGKDTGLLVSNAKIFGPVDNTVKIYAQKEFPWGSINSKVITVNDSDSNIYNLSIEPANDEAKNKLMETINEFKKSLEKAYTNSDSSKLVNASEELIIRITKKIADNIKNNQLYNRIIKKSVYDLNDIQIDKNGTSYKVSITCSETYTGGWYYQNSTSLDNKEYYLKTEYTLDYDMASNKWSVDATSSIGLYRDFNPINKKEFIH